MRKHSRPVFVVLALLLLAGLATAGVVLAQQPQAPPAAAGQQPPAGGQQAGPRPPAPGEDKPFDDVVKDMEVRKGLFTFYYKADENKTLMELQPDQLDKLFLFAGSTDKMVGERGLYAAQMGSDFPVYFHRVGKTIQLLQKNTNFTADKGTPADRAMARSFTDSILGSAKLQSKPHPDRKSILIDAAELLITDLPGFTPGLNRVYQPTVYRFDRNNSAIGQYKLFPDNVLLDVWLHYVTDNPRAPSIALPDARSIPVMVKYELSSLKDTGYKPRLADDRVGHFLVIQQDFTSDRPSSPYRRMITRWHLEKADPSARLSPPKEPIVFWLENTIPTEYRAYFKEGVLEWNKAFERIGFKDAVVVKQMPDDADWDPADTRYNTIRWFAAVDASFAIGPSRANPFTGQIYDADIGFSEGIVRSARRAGEELVGPVSMGFEEQPVQFTTGWLKNSRVLCTYANDLAIQAAMALDLLDARGMLTPEEEERLMREYIIEVTAHEVGHTLGLRHNFRASTILTADELNDTAKTSQLGQSSSVMDYNPIIIAGKGEKQGHYVSPTLGPYDYWAIEYAYKPMGADESAELAKIASRVADPMIPYSTDEDAIGTFSPQSIDPRANQFDASSDPVAYFRKRIAILNELWIGMESKLAKQGGGYQILRRALNRSFGEYNRAVLTSSKYVGGIYHYRDHVGDPNGRPPFTPVPAAKQREALEFLRTFAFSEKAFQLPPGLMNKLAAERLPTLEGIGGLFSSQRIDYPYHAQVLALQTGVLNRLHHAITLARIQDNELRFASGEKPFTMADLFSGLSSAIWSELDGNATKVSSLRRNLQREHLKQLTRLVLRPASPVPTPPPPGFVPTPRPPEDATTLARASLLSIQSKIKAALASGRITDTTTRAHLDETSARIDAALKAQLSKPLE